MVDKKYTSEEATAKIKVLINQFYQDIGREEVEEIDLERENLLSEIDEILNHTNILTKYLIVEQFDLDNSINEEI